MARRVRTGVPRGISAAARCRLLASCDRESAGAARLRRPAPPHPLGTAGGGGRRLGLDDVDWHLGEIVVHGKGDRVEKMPLPVDVGEAVAVYLSKGRPRAESRAVFLRAIAPWTALSAGGVTWIVYDACRRAGVERVGAHCLRHTAASDMLAAGASSAR